jgi:cobalamin synthase
MASTVLLVYEGAAHVDGWLDSIDAALLGRRLRDRRRTAVAADAVLHCS